MSELEQIVRDALADPMVDMVTIIRSPKGDWQASIKRAYRGWNVHHDADPVKALQAALTASAPALVTSKPPAPPVAPAVDDDLFG